MSVRFGGGCFKSMKEKQGAHGRRAVGKGGGSRGKRGSNACVASRTPTKPPPPRRPHAHAERRGPTCKVRAVCVLCALGARWGARKRGARHRARRQEERGRSVLSPAFSCRPTRAAPPPRHGPGIEPIAKKEKRKRCRFFLGGVSLKRKERQRVGWCAPLDSSPRPKAIATQRASHASARKCGDSVVSPHHRASRTPHAGQRPGRGGQRSEREGWKNRTHTHTQKPAHADASRRRPPDATPADCTVSSSDGAGAAAAAATAFALAPAASHALPIASRDR